ncbi:hypothetical protein PAMA_021116 [Pampus argenteus]
MQLLNQKQQDNVYKDCLSFQDNMLPASASATSSNQLACIALGGNLASIRTADDYAILRGVVNNATGEDKASWIGGYDAVKEGSWTWSDGSAFEFTGWANGEPNNYLYAEHCMEMNFEGRDYVNDERCNEWRSFICAKDAE